MYLHSVVLKFLHSLWLYTGNIENGDDSDLISSK